MEALEHLKQVLHEVERRKEQERCRFFVPNGKQDLFIKAVGEGKHFILLYLGANSAGKTTVLSNIFANIIWGPQSEWFDYPLFRNWPYPKFLRIVTEAKDIGETGSIDTEIDKWWPKGRYQKLKEGKNYFSLYKADSGFKMDKMSFEQETTEFEAVTLGAIGFNEPPPEKIFDASVSRMRAGGIILFSLTALKDASWIMDRLVDSHSEKTFVINADIEDNCIQHGIRGALKHEHLQNLIDNWHPDEVEARAHGKFIHLSDVIFGKSFDRQHHIIPDDTKPPEEAQFGIVVDPARGKPWAIGRFWVDARGQIVFDDEYPKEDWLRIKETKLTLRDYADILKIMEAGNQIEWRIIDRHFANARNDYGTTLKMDLSDKFGFDFINSYACEEEIETGIQKVKDKLGFDVRRAVDSLNYPRLKVKERCKNIIRSMERWDRDPETLRPKADSPFKDHADLVRYAATANLELYFPRKLAKREPGYVLGR